MPLNQPWKLYSYFVAYYFAQGIFQSYTAFEQPYLQSFGVDLEHVALAQSLAQLPWVLKIIFAIPSDMFNCGGLGFRRPYAIVGLAVGAAFLAVLGSFDAGRYFSLYIFVAILRNTGVCISDVATDGFAVDSGMEDQSGLINAAMTVGRMCGLITGSQVAGVLATDDGFGVMLYVLSGLIALVVLVPLMLKEERQTGRNDFEWAAFKQFGHRTVLLFLFSSCASNMALAIAAFPMAKWQQDRFGFSLEDVGTGSAVASAGLLIGSILNGRLFDRVNKRLAMAVAGAVSSATLLFYLLAFDKASVLAARFFAGLAEGALWIVEAGLAMRLADKRTGASFFALAIMAMNLAIMLGNGIAGPLAERVSLEACFAVAGGISFLQLLPIPWLSSLDTKGGDAPISQAAGLSATVAGVSDEASAGTSTAGDGSGEPKPGDDAEGVLIAPSSASSAGSSGEETLMIMSGPPCVVDSSQLGE